MLTIVTKCHFSNQELARDLVRLQTFALLADMLCGLATPLLDYELEQEGDTKPVPHSVSSNPSALHMRYISVAPRIESERSGERTPTAREHVPWHLLHSEAEPEQNRQQQVNIVKFIYSYNVHCYCRM